MNAAPGSAGSSSLALLVSSVEIVGVDTGSCGEAVARELAAPCVADVPADGVPGVVVGLGSWYHWLIVASAGRKWPAAAR